MIKVSAYANLNDAMAACASTFGDAGGELVWDKATTIVYPIVYPHHNLSIRGEGNASKATTTLPSGDLLTFARSDGSEIRNTLIQDVAILPAATRNSGWGVRLKKGVRWTLNNVDIGSAETLNMHSGGLWADGYDDSTVNDCNIYAKHKGVLVNGYFDQSYGADLTIGGGTKIVNHKRDDMADAIPGAIGLHLAGGQGGTYVDTTQMIYCGIGILIDRASAGVLNREIFLNPGTVVDSCVEDGIRVMDQAVGTLQMTGTWSSSNGRGGSGEGLSVEANQHPIMDGVVTGGKFYNNRGDGIALNGGDWAIYGPSIMDNGGYGLHIPNGATTGYADAKFRRNGLGPVRNLASFSVSIR